jgi:uracil-DNA glycosylase
VTVATDEIYEKYLQKAITEINALGDEVAQAGAGTRIPVVGSGHPLGDVFLLKYEPRASELQEGVAFFGRAGNALLKSLQRLRVDPMAVYGTNCLKFADGDEEETFTPTIDAFFTPDIDDSLDDQPAKTRFWNAFKLLGEWWASLPPY